MNDQNDAYNDPHDPHDEISHHSQGGYKNPYHDNVGSCVQHSANASGGQTPPPQIIYQQVPEKKKRFSFLRFLGRVLFGLSILANIVLFLIVVALIGLMAPGGQQVFMEQIVQEGNPQNKIAIIRVEGVIDNELSGLVRKQIKKAGEDQNVKAVIVRVISPGGGVSASDQIHHAIRSYKEEYRKPAVSFMQTVAASGGYYSSVACDSIVAEPTTITGSIGVIATQMVLQSLLEEKLGVTPYIYKSGQKKDWPSAFTPPTEEQQRYVQEKLIEPAYDRFVKLVNAGRTNLSESEVLALADGSIYHADEALEKGLIDKVGYLDTAIETAAQLANINNPHVVEYKIPFSFPLFMQSQSQWTELFEPSSVHEWMAPRVMYLWTGQ